MAYIHHYYRNMPTIKTEKGFRIFITFAVVSALGLAHTLGWAYKTMDNAKDLIAETNSRFEKVEDQVASRTGLYGLKIDAINVTKVQQGGLMSFSGVYTKTNDNGEIEPTAVSARFLVNEYLANTLMKKMDEVQNLSPNLERISHSQMKQVSESFADLFNMFGACVNQQYLGYSEIGNANDLQKSVNSSYGYTSPQTMSKTQNIISTKYENVGHQIVNISEVYYDENLQKYFFYIDSVTGAVGKNTGEIDCHRARVDVDGTGLTEADVYAKFLTGQHTKFVSLELNNSQIKQIASHFAEAEYAGRQF